MKHLDVQGEYTSSWIDRALVSTLSMQVWSFLLSYKLIICWQAREWRFIV